MAISLNEINQSLDFSFTSTPEKCAALILGIMALTAIGVIANAATEDKEEGQFIGGLITLLICTTALNMMAKQVDQQVQQAEDSIDQKRIALEKHASLLTQNVVASATNEEKV